jgi:hypothetical protein
MLRFRKGGELACQFQRRPGLSKSLKSAVLTRKKKLPQLCPDCNPTRRADNPSRVVFRRLFLRH